MGEPLTKKLLVIGWDAADWKHIQPLIDRGWMPTLKQFMAEGVWGNSATLSPILSPMLWTSIATGKRPYKHGIHGFIEPMPDGNGVRPSSSTTRTCKAIWNILTQQGLRTHQVGWFCSHPAEPINGVYVSNMYDRVASFERGDWPLPPQCVHPAELHETLAPLRLHPTELVPEQILPFIPNAAKIDQHTDPRLGMFAKLLCEMVNLHTVTTWIMENREWDFMATYNPAIDHFCHGFMPYHPPQMSNVRDEDFEIYSHVIAGVYRFHDMMLARMLQLAGEDCTVILCSDHGFHCDHLRPLQTPQEPAGPAVWHREYGIVAMKGPGIRQGKRIYGASVLDITPTVLALLGLPVGDDMDGKPLVQAMDRPPVWPARIASWEQVAGDAGMHASDKREDPFEARQAVQQLVDLGYVDRPDDNAQRAASNADREARYGLARAYLNGGLVNEATALLEVLAADQPHDHRFGLHLAQCYLALKRRAEARSLIEGVLDRVQQHAGERAAQLDQQRQTIHARAAWQAQEDQAVQDGRAEFVHRADAQSPAVDSAGVLRITPHMLQRADERIDRAQQHLRHLDVRITPSAMLLLGTLELYEKRTDAALARLLEAEKAEPRLPGLHIQIGRAYLRMKREGDAQRAFRKALDIDGDSAQAHDGMAAACLRLHKPTLAAEHALKAVGLLHHFPRAHLRLGIALTHLKMYDKAVEAFETCLKIAPLSVAPHRWLMRIYQQRLARPDLAAEHRTKMDYARRARRERRAKP